MSPIALFLLVGIAAAAFEDNFGPNSDVSDLDPMSKRAGDNWMRAADEKRARNPYSWMSLSKTQGKRARNPYSWMANKVTKRSPRLVDDLFRAPRNPYSWQYTMFDKRARNPYSWMNE